MNKKVKNAALHEYEGVKLKSGLELFCFKCLREAGIKFIYQPSRAILLEKFDIDFKCYEEVGKIFRDENKKIVNTTKRFDHTGNVGSISYTPDFCDPDGDWIIETKGFANESFPLRWKMFKRLLANQEFAGILMKPQNQKQVLQCIGIINEQRNRESIIQQSENSPQPTEDSGLEEEVK